MKRGIDMKDRRKFLKLLAAATGGVVVAPILTSCHRSPGEPGEKQKKVSGPGVRLGEDGMLKIPLERPVDWDPVAFNKIRGNQGAIPKSYLPDINGEYGVPKHLGKHLPYRPRIDVTLVPEGFLAIMWGNPDRGWAQHPQSPKGSEDYPRGHWYDWVRVRRATRGEAVEVESRYSAWPESGKGDSGLFVASDGGKLEADGGRNTVYLVKLPTDLVSGDTLRIYGHCLYHGEYVDFVDV